MIPLFLALVASAHELPKNLSSDLVFSKDGGILPFSLGKLSELADALKAEPALVVEVRVHTDTEEDATAQLAVTQRRAELLRAWLVDRGVRKEQLTGVGVGSAEPIADNRTSSGRARNRRVEFKLIHDVDHGKTGETGPVEKHHRD